MSTTTYTSADSTRMDSLLSLPGPTLERLLSELDEANREQLKAELAWRLDTSCPTKAAQRLEAATNGQADTETIRRLCAYHWPDSLLDWWQVELIGAILSARNGNLSQVAIKGCTKAGKGFAVALATCLWYQVPGDCKVVIISQSHKHAHDVMFGEVLRQLKRMHGRSQTKIGDRQVKSNEQKFIVTASPESGEGFSGFHGPATLFIFDEASSCSGEYWDQSLTQSALSVALSNPRTMSGWFRRLYPSHSEDRTQAIDIPGGRRRLLVTIGGSDCLNVIEGKVLIADQIDAERYASIMAHQNPQWRRVMGEGKFPEQDADKRIIGYEWMERHMAAHRVDLPVDSFALDVAASIDGDRSVLAAGGMAGCAELFEWREADVMQVVGLVLQAAESRKVDLRRGQNPIAVDMIGPGIGVGNRLRELGCLVLEIRGNDRSGVDPKRYANLRAELYGELGRRLDPKGPWPDDPWALPVDDELVQDLTTPEKIIRSDGFSFHITPKERITSGYKGDTLRDVLHRSPDRGDAVVMLWHAVRECHRSRGRRRLNRPLLCGDQDTKDVKLSPFLQSLVDAGKPKR